MASRTIMANAVVPLAGYANPKYIDPAGPDVAIGFDISGAKGILISVASMGSNTMMPEQTLDPTGLTGWFSVVGKQPQSLQGALSQGLASGNSLLFPALGIRMRFRVTALAGADTVTSIGLIADTMDLASISNVGLGAGTQLVGATSQGASATVGTGTARAKIKAAATINATVVKNGAGKLFRYTFRNNTAVVKYAKLYNKGASVPAPAADSALLIETIIIPANGVATYLNPIGSAFSTGLGYVITAAIAETDVTAVAVDDVVGVIDYI